jgi:hypothetical protein
VIVSVLDIEHSTDIQLVSTGIHVIQLVSTGIHVMGTVGNARNKRLKVKILQLINKFTSFLRRLMTTDNSL